MPLNSKGAKVPHSGTMLKGPTVGLQVSEYDRISRLSESATQGSQCAIPWHTWHTLVQKNVASMSEST